MTENVFNPGEQSQTPIDENTNYLEQLVGEGKKFDSPESLARGKAEADAYIETLIKKQDELRAELEKRSTAEEVADQLRKQLASNQGSNPAGTPNPQGEPNDDPNKQNQPQGLSQDEILEFLNKQLTERETQAAAQKNIAEVSKVLSDKIGATAGKYVQDKAAELGMSVKELEAQAARSPKAFFKLIDLGERPNTTTSAPPASSVSVPSTSSGSVRNQKYYEKLYAENPKLRFDKQTTVQEHKDALALGSKFFE